jgi:phenylacetic acid degradation operon negative regulatory protein
VVVPGVFSHPAADAQVLEQLLARTGVKDKLFVCQASALPGAGGRPLRELVEDGWDLSGVVAGYEGFMAQFQPLLALLQGAPALEPQQAFIIRSLLIHAYRRVQLHDPQLPVELLPEPWPGAQAYELARAIYQLSYAPAEQYIMATLRREDEQAAEAGASFYQRFGGLH